MATTIYNRPNTSPSGLDAVIAVLNHGNGFEFEVTGVGPARNAYVQNFASGGESFISITPNPDIAVSWSRNMVDCDLRVALSYARIVSDHRGRPVAIVTGSSVDAQGRQRHFALTPLTPRNPGGSTAFDQKDELTHEFVQAVAGYIGKPMDLKVHGMPAALPVKTGRGRRAPSLQVSGMTAGTLSYDGALVWDGYSKEFRPDPDGAQPPAIQKRETINVRAMDLWPVLTDELAAQLTSASGEPSPTADASSDIEELISMLS